MSVLPLSLALTCCVPDMPHIIKEQKKNRQIIFATHNANFVINADADLIIKLSNEYFRTKKYF